MCVTSHVPGPGSADVSYFWVVIKRRVHVRQWWGVNARCARVPVHTCARTHVWMYARVPVHTCGCTHVCPYTHVDVRTCARTHMWMYEGVDDGAKLTLWIARLHTHRRWWSPTCGSLCSHPNTLTTASATTAMAMLSIQRSTAGLVTLARLLGSEGGSVCTFVNTRVHLAARMYVQRLCPSPMPMIMPMPMPCSVP
jgi:hypothetical protein